MTSQHRENPNSPYKFDDNGRVIIPTKKELTKLPKNGGKLFNRLVFESSPYLLQHAANPVDWYPWGEEAFQTAKNMDKPVFLSIGYSTCHWCHVMEEESFADPEIAALMNDAFICVKVDREERPDIDNVYMEITQMINNRGGWPMTVILTPEKEAFFAATYIPRDTRYNRTGMRELIPQINSLWKNSRNEVLKDASEITKRLKTQISAISTYDDIKPNILDIAFNQFNNSFDETWGGFNEAPKFPKAHDYMFLAKYFNKTKNKQALSMVEKSLIEMRYGGMYDQIGYGFHRYSTDIRWLVPHFEKMLYDQAILTMAYLEAFEATNDPVYAEITREILEYVIRDMTSPEGGFYSAEDADSEGEEGIFYVWSTKETEKNLGSSEAALFNDLFNLNPKGNYNEGRRHLTNIPHLRTSLKDYAGRHSMSITELTNSIEKSRNTLFSVRENRIHPYKDDKILTDWNGLMIAAFARAAVVLEDEKFAKIAQNAMRFILNTLTDDQGRLFKRYRDDSAGKQAVLDDYAFTIWALIELYHLTFDVNYLTKASELADYQYNHFWDWDANGFFFTSDDSEELIVRTKEVYDGAVPSGNSVSAYNYIRLGRLLSRPDFEEIAFQITEAFASRVNRYPKGYSMMLQAIDFLQGPSFEVLVFGDESKKETQQMIKTIREVYQPNKVVLFGGMKEKNISKVIPFANNYPTTDDGSPIVYVCQNYTCKLPTSDVKTVQKLLENN